MNRDSPGRSSDPSPAERAGSPWRGLQGWYLCLAVLGAVVPYALFIPWVREHGLDPRALVMELFSTRIGGFFGLDVLISAVVLLSFIAQERRRRRLPHAWVAVLATCLVGVSCGLPLFLYLRDRVPSAD